jgi:chromosomal replication initiator protein
LLANPENRVALAAMQDVLFDLTSPAGHSTQSDLLYLHGPSGSGKSLMVATLLDALADANIHACSLSANDFADAPDLDTARQADLLVVEDLQHLPLRCAETMIDLIDDRAQHGAPTIVTAVYGPSGLVHRDQPHRYRLTNRLAAGVVVALAPMTAPSRRRFLEVKTGEASLNLRPEILDWLADHLAGGGRQLEGAIRQLRSLQRMQSRPLQLSEVRAHFVGQLESQGLERIVDKVSSYFRVPAKRMLAASRSRDVMLPRQVAFYLARQLTGLSLQKIGAYAGGRDHKTVDHACRRIEAAAKVDPTLRGALGQLTAQLS